MNIHEDRITTNLIVGTNHGSLIKISIGMDSIKDDCLLTPKKSSRSVFIIGFNDIMDPVLDGKSTISRICHVASDSIRFIHLDPSSKIEKNVAVELGNVVVAGCSVAMGLFYFILDEAYIVVVTHLAYIVAYAVPGLECVWSSQLDPGLDPSRFHEAVIMKDGRFGCWTKKGVWSICTISREAKMGAESVRIYDSYIARQENKTNGAGEDAKMRVLERKFNSKQNLATSGMTAGSSSDYNAIERTKDVDFNLI